MKKDLLTAIFLLLSAGLSAQTNILEKNLGGRGSDDDLSRKYLTPARLIALPGGEGNGVENAHLLLERFDGQLSTSPAATCVMNTRDGRNAAILIDFGAEISGGIEISAPGREKQKTIKVRVRLGESVSETFSDAECRTDLDEPMLTATNDHSLRDYTAEVPWMGSVEVGNSGFRFVRIDLAEAGEVLPLRAVRAVVRYRDIPYTGSFACSDKRLTKIWETGAYTIHLCMQEYLWDGAKRDRLVWMGDMHPEVMTIGAVFGSNPVVTKSLDFARDNTPLPGWMNGIPSYSMWWIMTQRDLYLHCADREYLAEQHDYLKGVLRQIASGIAPDGRETLDGWRFMDWPTAEMPGAIHAGYQSLVRMSLLAGVELGEWLGDGEMVKECRAALSSVDGYIPDHGGNKQAAALSALSGMEDPTRIAREILAAGGPEGFSTFYGYYMLEAMAAGGMHGEAMKTMSQYWGAMIDMGATTFWENLEWSDVMAKPARIDEIVPAGAFDIHSETGRHCYPGLRHSLCHGWATGPTAWLSRHVLGVEPLEPGFKKVRIEPHLGDLEWARGTVPTPHGPITVHHTRRADGTVASSVKAPAGVTIVRQSRRD
jgi:hypothetical protein